MLCSIVCLDRQAVERRHSRQGTGLGYHVITLRAVPASGQKGPIIADERVRMRVSRYKQIACVTRNLQLKLNSTDVKGQYTLDVYIYLLTTRVVRN